MRRLFVFIAVVTIVCCVVTCSYSVEYWAKTYGGSAAENAYTIQQTTDGGYIVAWRTRSFGAGEDDIWVLKLDSSGGITWQKTYGGTGPDEAFSIQQTSDGGYILGGYTHSFTDNANAWLLKLDNSGNILWQQTYEGSSNSYDDIRVIQETDDGGYIATGRIIVSENSWDIWILKLDSFGNITWEKTYGGNDIEYPNSLQQTSDGGYVVAGQTHSFGAGSWDFWVLKLASNGDVTWEKTYGETELDHAYAIQQTTDGGFIVVGDDRTSGAYYNIRALKLNTVGDVTWQKKYSGFEWDTGRSVQQTSDGGYIICGWTRTFGNGDADSLVIKLDSDGNITWQKTYGDVAWDAARSIQQTLDGGYILAGATQSFGAGVGSNDLWILKVDDTGDIPDCNIINTSNVLTADTQVSVQDTSSTVQTNTATVTTTNITPQVTTADVSTICSWSDLDSDDDGIPDNQDNCPDIPNGSELGTCVHTSSGAIGTTCMNDGECSSGEVCNNNQQDRDNDGSGDACDNDMMCKGNFDFDNDVDGTDASLFKAHFGRSTFKNPCPPDGPAPAEQTGQTTSYATGDDGDHQSGVPFPEPRFVDNEDGTVTDNLTGLMWTKDANLPMGALTWQEGLNYVSAMNDGVNNNFGYNDWRVPNINELHSLTNYEKVNPALPLEHPFVNVQSVNNKNTDCYWSSSTVADVTDRAWTLFTHSGDVFGYLKTSIYFVWPVRGGH